MIETRIFVKTHDRSNESIPDRLVAVDGWDRGHEH
jgi:hypothetical protein